MVDVLFCETKKLLLQTTGNTFYNHTFIIWYYSTYIILIA